MAAALLSLTWLRLATSSSVRFGGRQPYLFVRKIPYVILPNRTLASIMEEAKASNTSTMMWAVTGKNLGPYYVEQGVDCVISDPLPFLMLPGPATIGICRREH
jgi:hypothetical protein